MIKKLANCNADVTAGKPNTILHLTFVGKVEHKDVITYEAVMPTIYRHWWYDQNGPATDLGII